MIEDEVEGVEFMGVNRDGEGLKLWKGEIKMEMGGKVMWILGCGKRRCGGISLGDWIGWMICCGGWMGKCLGMGF